MVHVVGRLRKMNGISGRPVPLVHSGRPLCGEAVTISFISDSRSGRGVVENGVGVESCWD